MKEKFMTLESFNPEHDPEVSQYTNNRANIEFDTEQNLEQKETVSSTGQKIQTSESSETALNKASEYSIDADHEELKNTTPIEAFSDFSERQEISVEDALAAEENLRKLKEAVEGFETKMKNLDENSSTLTEKIQAEDSWKRENTANPNDVLENPNFKNLTE